MAKQLLISNKDAYDIVKKNIPNGIINVKAIGKGNGVPQFQAEVDIIIKCMEEYSMLNKLK